MKTAPEYRVTGQRTRNIFNPVSEEPFKLSRSKIELFTECPRCFYLDRRLGVGRPPGFPFTLNSAVDTLLKKEFDIHRNRGSRHPLMEAHGIDAVPFVHEKIPEWRDNFKGVQHYHRPTNLVITGALDDVWINKEGELMVVDYKATSTKNEVTLNAKHHEAFKRQLEVYQWLLRRNDFKVSDMGYFVYANGDKDKKAFNGKLEFNVKIIPYKGSDSWVEEKIVEAHKCMMGKIPKSSPICPYCLYREAAGEY